MRKLKKIDTEDLIELDYYPGYFSCFSCRDEKGLDNTFSKIILTTKDRTKLYIVNKCESCGDEVICEIDDSDIVSEMIFDLEQN